MIELIKEILFGVSDSSVQYAILPAAMVAMGAAQTLMAYDWGGKRRKALNRAREQYEAQKRKYAGLETTVENPFVDLQNAYDNMENTFEDLTINQQQAEFERQTFQQQQKDTMESLRQAAGGSGIASLAQAMANQSATQAQRAAASIGQQEARNRMLAAQQAAKIDQLQAGEESKIQQLEAQGEFQANLRSMQMEQSKQATLLGMDAQSVAGAQRAVAAGQQQMASGIGTMAMGVMSAYNPNAGPDEKSFNFLKK
tara:strand:- start:1401 stop:2165 length:765 start_codon:yes stop_codon:yes gene_type:complete